MPQGMLGPACLVTRDRALVRDLLLQSAGHHNKLTLASVAGLGVDRHLLGLRMVAATSGTTPYPAVFAHEAFRLPWSLSTSQVLCTLGMHVLLVAPPMCG